LAADPTWESIEREKAVKSFIQSREELGDVEDFLNSEPHQ